MSKKLLIAVAILLGMTFQLTIHAAEVEKANQATANVSTKNTKLADHDAEPVTKAWLELQRSGSQASPHAQTLSGPVMQNVYDRYKESFSRPIPQATEQDARKIK